MRRCWLSVVLLLAGCGELEDLFFVYGRETTLSGGPVVDRPLRLNALDPYSLAPALLTSTATDGEGRYSFELYRFELIDASGLPRKFSIEASGPDGAITRLQFSGLALDQGLPDLLLWDRAQPGVMELADQLVLQTPSFPVEPLGPPPGAVDAFETRAYSWMIESEGLRLWEAPANASGMEVRLPREVLEDFPGAIAVFSLQSMTQPPRDPLLGVMPAAFSSVRAAPTALRAGPGAPISRGASCWMRGTLVPACPATDGELDPSGDQVFTDWLFGQDGQPLGELIRFDLGSPRRLRLLLARNLSDGRDGLLAVEGSNDLQSWVPLGAVSRATPLVELDPLAPAVQFVRLTTELSTAALTLQELSLYE